MRFDFSGAGSPFLHHGKYGPPIVIKDAAGDGITIEQLPVTQAYKILGTYQAAVASQRQQHSVLKKKATNHCGALALSNVSKRGAWIYYSSFFLRSVGYPLGVLPPLQQSTGQSSRPNGSHHFEKNGLQQSYEQVSDFWSYEIRRH
jgi:hypothetical protein